MESVYVMLSDIEKLNNINFEELAIGQQIITVRPKPGKYDSSDDITENVVEITKIGRKWVEFATRTNSGLLVCENKFDSAGRVYNGKYTPDTTVFLSKEDFLNKKEQFIAGKKLLSQIEYLVKQGKISKTLIEEIMEKLPKQNRNTPS